MKYISIDIETTGLLPTSCDVIELAAVLEDTDNPRVPIKNLPTYTQVYKSTNPLAWHSEAKDMHFKSGLYALQDKASHSFYEAMQKREDPEGFHAWLDTVGYKDKQAVAAGKNLGGFDFLFFPQALKKRFGYRVIDAGSVCINWSKERVPTLKELTRGPIEHRALADAQAVIAVLRKTYHRRG